MDLRNEDLIEAVKDGSLDRVKRLISIGADPNTTTAGDKSTPLHLAAEFNRTDIVDELLYNIPPPDVVKVPKLTS